ncbi:MAG: hypothetical protein KM310_11220 [Clostridiales bacterium]|nr:hypothetical protein [Clostridiales bacterium]
MTDLLRDFLVFLPFIALALVLKGLGLASPYLAAGLIAGIFLAGAARRRRQLRREGLL